MTDRNTIPIIGELIGDEVHPIEPSCGVRVDHGEPQSRLSREHREEIARLAAISRRADEKVSDWNYLNIAGLSAEALDQVAQNGAIFRAEAMEARTRLDAYIRRASDEAAASDLPGPPHV